MTTTPDADQDELLAQLTDARDAIDRQIAAALVRQAAARVLALAPDAQLLHLDCDAHGLLADALTLADGTIADQYDPRGEPALDDATLARHLRALRGHPPRWIAFGRQLPTAPFPFVLDLAAALLAGPEECTETRWWTVVGCWTHAIASSEDDASPFEQNPTPAPWVQRVRADSRDGARAAALASRRREHADLQAVGRHGVPPPVPRVIAVFEGALPSA